MIAFRASLKISVVALTSFFTISAFALPNLTPYQPSGWSDKIVVSTVTGTSTDSSPLTTADTLYVDWAVVNFGTTAAGSFATSLYVDGVLQNSWNNSSLGTSTYTYFQDYSIGSLSAGTHTITITADSGNTVAESNESDNSYSKIISVGGSTLPNLAPYQPPGWSDKIVVSTVTGTSTDSSPLINTNTLYVDWAVINNGNSAAGAFTTSLYVDGVLQTAWNTSSLATNVYTSALDYNIGILSAGAHTITITTDSGNAVSESSESDNTYTKNITVNTPSLPNLTPYQPGGWGDKVVVSTVTGTSTDSSPIYTTNTLYVDWCVINNGTVTAGSFTTSLYVDGVLKNSWSNGSLPVNGYTYFQDYSIGSLTAGTHTVSITADSGSTVGESNEADNSYTNTITVLAATAPAPTLLAPVNGSAGQSTSPAFSWSAVSGVSGYRIIIATNAADLPASATAGTGGPSVMVNSTTTNTTFTPPEPVDPGTTYYWEVHAYNGSDYGTWSAIDSFTTGVPPSGLAIIPTFDSTITSDPQAAIIESTINAAIAVYQSSFSDPVTVHITFYEMTNGLGLSSGVYYQGVSYSSYRSALVAHATTPDDTTALAYLPSVANNPVNGNSTVNLKYALARALGYTANPPAGQPDGKVNLNTSIMNLSEASSDPSKFSLFGTVSHEIDEVLGFSSALNGLANGAPAPTGAIFPEDLFRYDQTGARSFTTDSNAASYFSLDGTTDLARFNQYEGGDFQDWYSYYGGQIPEVQDAFSPPDTNPILGVELRVLDAIGFTRVLSQFTITASAGTGGVISPSGTISKAAGSNQSFTATPNSGYLISQWLLDATVVQTGGSSYTLTNIQTNHAVQVNFATKTNQTINFGVLTNKTLGEPAFAVSATASSGLLVSFSILSGPATIAGSTVTITGTGTIIVRATQAGDANYNAAPNVDQSFTVYPRPSASLATSGQNLIISWPTNVAGFSVYSTTNLNQTNSWTLVVPAPVIVNGHYVVTNAISGTTPRKFYRLMK